MNFSVMELYALIHDLKQELWQIRRVDRSGMRPGGQTTIACIQMSELRWTKKNPE
jgi:hypothetical protein